MSDRHKVFISFAGEDRPLATRLHRDLSERGAEVFQFLESAQPGTSAWKQVLDSIDESNWFIVLLSRAALESPAVGYEIEHAQYQYINNNRKPRLIPAIVENVEKPRELRTVTDLSFHDYTAALNKLTTMIGLTPAAKNEEEARPQTETGTQLESRTKDDPSFRGESSARDRQILFHAFGPILPVAFQFADEFLANSSALFLCMVGSVGLLTLSGIVLAARSRRSGALKLSFGVLSGGAYPTVLLIVLAFDIGTLTLFWLLSLVCFVALPFGLTVIHSGRKGVLHP